MTGCDENLNDSNVDLMVIIPFNIPIATLSYGRFIISMKIIRAMLSKLNYILKICKTCQGPVL